MNNTAPNRAADVARIEAMVSDLEARRAANLAHVPELGSGTLEAFDIHIAAARRLLARLTAA